MERIRVAALADLPDGTGRQVEVAGRRIALFRVGGEVFALADRCSHDEASLAEGEVLDHTVECPRHGASFDLRTGEALSLPATHGVAVWRAEVEGGDVYLWVEPAGEGIS
jgi:3-phenylpropionate/trans-cinnamate dioxygenase ferredoxin subunit